MTLFYSPTLCQNNCVLYFCIYSIQLLLWLPLVRSQHCVLVNAIFMGECAILILQKIMVLTFLWYSLLLTQYSYYRDFFCLGTASRIRNRYRHVWVRFIDDTKITAACMSLMLFSIDLRWYWYFNIFYFKLTNGAIEKWWMVKWCNEKIEIRISPFVYHKYWICSFILFCNTTFSQQTKKFIIYFLF